MIKRISGNNWFFYLLFTLLNNAEWCSNHNNILCFVNMLHRFTEITKNLQIQKKLMEKYHPTIH